ncbi:MAG TPA: TonB-dependent receptor, partial [Sphingomicrobium sp.]|nr:TonB-dependent receptor [Sphingomicrobium sp.]
MLSIKKSRAISAGALLCATCLSTPAFAQDVTPPTDVQGGTPAPADDQTPPAGVQSSEAAAPAEETSSADIVVTGTLIRNPNLVASAPVTVVGQEEIQLKQSNVAEEVLRTIPGVVPSIGSNVNNGNGGASFVNLRGLGANRNVVLLDGTRIVPANLIGIVDLNNIPLALVDRVDVLTGGASSTYGADAVGGVVNFITRSDFAGVELSASEQITERGDGNILRTDLTIGANFDDGRGNAVISLGYQEADPVFFGGDRPFSQVTLESLDEFFVAGQGSSTTVPSAFDIGGGRPRQQISADGLGIQNFYKAFNFNPFNIFQTPFKRYNMYGAGHYDVADGITVYARGMYSNNTVDTIIAPSGVFASSVVVPVSNPFLSAAQRTYFCGNADFDPNTPGNQTLTPAQCAAAAAATSTSDPNFRQFTVGLRRRTPEVGPRVTSFNTQMFDFKAGVRGDITDKIGFDVFAARGQSSNVTSIQNFVLLSRVRDALLATNPDSCLSGNEGCVPLNIFGQEGTITPAMADFISDASTVTNKSRLSQARGIINGEAGFSSPWADTPVSFAIGTEYRKYRAEQASDVLAKTPGELGGAGGAAPDINGGLEVYEGYAEVIAPLITDKPFFKSLTVEGGIRRSHYTVDTASKPKFKTTTWKIAGSWEPTADFKIRGNYQHAVRAPNISELFSPIATGLTNLGTDPCAGTITNPNLIAVCIAQGAPPSTIGFITNPTAGQANVTAGGNLNLQPEVANTWTVGAVLTPGFLRGFTATIDYYNIKVKDAITAATPDDLIAACFGNLTAASATDPACTVIGRNPISGGLDGPPDTTPGLFGPLSNLGVITTDGVDLTMNYRRTLGTWFGTTTKLNLAFGGNYTAHSKFQATPTSVDRECVGLYSVNCNAFGGAIQPKYSFNMRSTLSLGRVDLSLLWRYISKEKFEPLQHESNRLAAIAANEAAILDDPTIDPEDLPCFDFDGTDPGGCVVDPRFRKIKAYNYFDFATRFNVNEHFDMTITAVNIFDKKPPIV